MGPVLRGVRAVPDAAPSTEKLQEGPPEEAAGGSDQEGAVYNRTEEGEELRYAGHARQGRYKLRDIDVIRIRRNEEKLTMAEWARVYLVPYTVIHNAAKGYSYKYLNWTHPPRY